MHHHLEACADFYGQRENQCWQEDQPSTTDMTWVTACGCVQKSYPRQLNLTIVHTAEQPLLCCRHELYSICNIDNAPPPPPSPPHDADQGRLSGLFSFSLFLIPYGCSLCLLWNGHILSPSTFKDCYVQTFHDYRGFFSFCYCNFF
jgi:hypothetical protein